MRLIKAYKDASISNGLWGWKGPTASWNSKPLSPSNPTAQSARQQGGGNRHYSNSTSTSTLFGERESPRQAPHRWYNLISFPSLYLKQASRRRRWTIIAIMLFSVICAIAVPVAVVFGKQTVRQKRIAATASKIPATGAAFEAQNGTEWTMDYLGEIQFGGDFAGKGLGGDKCRTSTLGGKTIWNCGDMECDGDPYICGFSMGPAFYGTDDVMQINLTAYDSIDDYTFAEPWAGDTQLTVAGSIYGMDTSNVVHYNSTHGIGYAYESIRETETLSLGNAAFFVTLGDDRPIATRIGPLLTNNETVQMGLLGVMRVGNYIYNYHVATEYQVIVGRVHANMSAFDADAYEYLTHESALADDPVWVPGIPLQADAASYGMKSNSSNGNFDCQTYGSIFFNNYFERYMMFCSLDLLWGFFYLAENPWGPWSVPYTIINEGLAGYGLEVHPSYSPNGDHSELYVSIGESGVFYMYKLSFDY